MSHVFFVSISLDLNASMKKIENHQILMCDTSKEPSGLIDHKSEESENFKILKIHMTVSKKTCSCSMFMASNYIPLKKKIIL